MRLWKKISIYIIYPILMLAVGFLASVKLHDFFYPSQNAKQEQQYVQDGGNGDTAENQESMEALGTGGAVITCDTRFVVKSLDLTDSSREEEESPIPEQYIGMDRDEFLSAMNSYSESPSLNDLRASFRWMFRSFPHRKWLSRKIMKAKRNVPSSTWPWKITM